MIMRSQGCTIQQALTPEAAAVVKQAVALAKRRGHAQVTPLHVAHTMLSVPSGLFRAACLQAHAHPLQCRALELCFNVALNRLPTSATGPMMGPMSIPLLQPGIANALVAAFKRAQAHQRRGVIENNQQQQPILTVKIELEQLIISILDDPSVSRVMREAGFSSPLVKAKVEEAISMENQDPSDHNDNNNPKVMGTKPSLIDNRNGDVMILIDSLMSRKKRNSILVGECVETLEGVVREVLQRVEKGEVPEGFKGVKSIKLNLSSFGHLCREEVEQRVDELKSHIKSCNKGVILFLDDLKWAMEFRAKTNYNNNILGDQLYYCPIEQLIMEIRKLIIEEYDDDGSKKLILLGIATFQTYMRCQSGQPSLESTWDLNAINFPIGSLELSLIHDRDLNLQNPSRGKKIEVNGSRWLVEEGGDGAGEHHRPGGMASVEGQIRQSRGSTTTSTLPPWLQQYKEEKSKRESNNNDKECMAFKDQKRWSSFCNTSIQPSPSISPSSTLNFSSLDNNYLKLHPTLIQSFETKNFFPKELQTNNTHEHKDHPHEQIPMATNFILSPNPNSSPSSTSSSDIRDQMESQCVLTKFNEYNADNLKTLCNALEQKAPHQKDIIVDIARTVLHCRSGKAGRKENCKENESPIKEETWLFFQGGDVDAKEKIARELARLIFGSQQKFISIGLSSFSSTRVESVEDSRNYKRQRDEQSCGYVEKFAEAVSDNPHRVFFIEDIEQVDYSSQIGIKKAIERGKIVKYSSGEEANFCDAIIIFSCERFRSRSRACSPSMHKDVLDDPKTSSSISLDLNISINDNNSVVGGESMDEIGLLASVDRCIVFNHHQD